MVHVCSKYGVPSLIHSMGPQNSKPVRLCGTDHALFGEFIIHRLVLAVVKRTVNLKSLTSPVRKIGKTTQTPQTRVA